MIIQQKLKDAVLFGVVACCLSACGGGGGGSSSAMDDPQPPPTPEPPPQQAADFNKMVIDLLSTGSTTLPDGQTYDGDSEPVALSDYQWEADSSNDEIFDALFEGP